MPFERFEQIYDTLVINFYMAYMFNDDCALHDIWGAIKLLKAYCNVHYNPSFDSFITEINLLENLYKKI